jgi:hypothetical protein
MVVSLWVLKKLMAPVRKINEATDYIIPVTCRGITWIPRIYELLVWWVRNPIGAPVTVLHMATSSTLRTIKTAASLALCLVCEELNITRQFLVSCVRAVISCICSPWATLCSFLGSLGTCLGYLCTRRNTGESLCRHQQPGHSQHVVTTHCCTI